MRRSRRWLSCIAPYNPYNHVDNKRKSTDSTDFTDFMLRIAKQLNSSKRSYASIIQEQISIIRIITLINKKSQLIQKMTRISRIWTLHAVLFRCLRLKSSSTSRLRLTSKSTLKSTSKSTLKLTSTSSFPSLPSLPFFTSLYSLNSQNSHNEALPPLNNT